MLIADINSIYLALNEELESGLCIGDSNKGDALYLDLVSKDKVGVAL